MEGTPKKGKGLLAIERLGLKRGSHRHPQTRSEVIVFLGNKVGPGWAKMFREARERAEKEKAAASSTSEPKPPED
jgi:hypothetical protein